MDAAHDQKDDARGTTDQAPTGDSATPALPEVSDLEVQAFHRALAEEVAKRGPMALDEGLLRFGPEALFDLFGLGGFGFGSRHFRGGFAASGPLPILNDEVVRSALAASRVAEQSAQLERAERERRLATAADEIKELLAQHPAGVDVYVALDRSGSARIREVCEQQAAIVAELGRLLPDVPLSVFGFSTSGHSEQSEIYPLKGLEDGSFELDWRQLHDLGGAATPTEAAIAYVREQADGRQRVPVLMIATDGEASKPKKALEQIEAARGEGVRVYGLFQPGAGSEDSAATLFGPGSWTTLAPAHHHRRRLGDPEPEPLPLALAGALQAVLAAPQTTRKLPLTEYLVVDGEEQARRLAPPDPHPGRMKSGDRIDKHELARRVRD